LGCRHREFVRVVVCPGIKASRRGSPRVLGEGETETWRWCAPATEVPAAGHPTSGSLGHLCLSCSSQEEKKKKKCFAGRQHNEAIATRPDAGPRRARARPLARPAWRLASATIDASPWPAPSLLASPRRRCSEKPLNPRTFERTVVLIRRPQLRTERLAVVPQPPPSDVTVAEAPSSWSPAVGETR